MYTSTFVYTILHVICKRVISFQVVRAFYDGCAVLLLLRVCLSDEYLH